MSQCQLKNEHTNLRIFSLVAHATLTCRDEDWARKLKMLLFLR